MDIVSMELASAILVIMKKRVRSCRASMIARVLGIVTMGHVPVTSDSQDPIVQFAIALKGVLETENVQPTTLANATADIPDWIAQS
jgi:hypothetical protein